MPDERKHDTTVPGGRYVVGGRERDGKRYGGRVVDANGNTLNEFADNEVNTGLGKDDTPVAHPTAAPHPATAPAPVPPPAAKPAPPK